MGFIGSLAAMALRMCDFLPLLILRRTYKPTKRSGERKGRGKRVRSRKEGGGEGEEDRNTRARGI
jgi:hypothetical protein